MEITETEEDIEKIAYRYRKMGYGYISKVYSKEVEKNYYRQAAKIVSTKYNQFITEQEMYEIISNRGKIFTMVVKGNRRAFLETQTGNIGISHFLDRMTELLLHELIHKVGYERNNKSFLYMSVIFKEAGTELIKSRALSDYTTKRFILKDLWASYPEKLDDSFLISSLVNQLNEAVGGQTLEKSILQGDDFFKPSIIEKYGEGSFIFLKENMEDLSREEMRYWTNFIDFPPEEQTEKNKKFKTQSIFNPKCYFGIRI